MFAYAMLWMPFTCIAVMAAGGRTSAASVLAGLLRILPIRLIPVVVLATMSAGCGAFAGNASALV